MNRSHSPPPDQTVGYENVSTDDLVVRPDSTNHPDATLPVTPEQLEMRKPSSSLKARTTFAASIMTPTGQHIPPEALVGPYEILDELGKGGMGIVYRARHVHLNRIAALKMILGGSWIGP